MTSERKQAVKSGLKKVGKAIWSTLPWIGLWLIITFLYAIPVLDAREKGEYEAQISALQAENARYEVEIGRLDENIAWLRSLIEQEAVDGQMQP